MSWVPTSRFLEPKREFYCAFGENEPDTRGITKAVGAASEVDYQHAKRLLVAFRQEAASIVWWANARGCPCETCQRARDLVAAYPEVVLP